MFSAIGEVILFLISYFAVYFVFLQERIKMDKFLSVTLIVLYILYVIDKMIVLSFVGVNALSLIVVVAPVILIGLLVLMVLVLERGK